MDVVGISALAVVAAILSVMLRRYHGEYGMLPSDMILKIPEAIQLGLENEAQVRKSRK